MKDNLSKPFVENIIVFIYCDYWLSSSFHNQVFETEHFNKNIIFSLQFKYEQDIQELNTLLNQATRTNVKQFLTSQLEKLGNEHAKLQKSEQERIEKLANKPVVSTGGYTKKM